MQCLICTKKLLALDAGSWFNETSIEQARKSFSEQHQYISALEDQIRYAEGKMLKRDVNGERIYTVTGTWNPDKPHDCLTYIYINLNMWMIRRIQATVRVSISNSKSLG